ncbi:bud emergence protein 1 [Coemansia sp. RSA 2336]|nr:bud emergence protein 1 [Coemansia sp. RSA 2336]
MGLTKRSSSAAPKLQAPKRVIRALRNYVAIESAELTFKKDDFFYVLSTPHESDRWYEVSNPLSGERGLVPASHFEIMESRQDRINRINRSASNASASGALPPGSTGQLGLSQSYSAGSAIYGLQASESGTQRQPSGSHPLASEATSVMSLRARTTSIQHAQHQRRPSQPFGSNNNGIVELPATALYSFTAANGNELTLNEDDGLLVVAKSTDDWLIARRVYGGTRAGLVPAAYVELRDPATGAVIGDLHTYLARNHVRLRTALEWEQRQRERSASRSTHSSASANSAYDDEAPTPRLSTASPQPTANSSGPSSARSRAMTASSSASSIAERSSFRRMPSTRKASGGSLQHLLSENFPPFQPNDVSAVSVPSFICKDGAYLFQISLQFVTGERRNIYRGYDDIIYCRNQLNESFPKEASSLKLARISMHSSSMLYLNDAIAERRRAEIDEYVNGLLKMPPPVIESTIVQRLFGSRVESDHPNVLSERSLQQQLLQSGISKHAPSLSADSTGDASFALTSASSTDTAVESHHPHDGHGMFTNKAKTMSCDAKVTTSSDRSGAGSRQLAHKSSMSALGGSNGTVKVKVRLGSDMVALRLPSGLTLSELKERIAMRMGNGSEASAKDRIGKILYQAPSGEAAALCDDQDWANALLETNYKPVLSIVQ